MVVRAELRHLFNVKHRVKLHSVTRDPDLSMDAIEEDNAGDAQFDLISRPDVTSCRADQSGSRSHRAKWSRGKC